MDQQSLRELEHRCIQEEPPPCAAACPLHVDARGFVGHVRHGHWEEALKILYKTMPLPGVLGRICDSVCQPACNRNAAGGAIRIGDLERICVQISDLPRQVMPLPKKEIAVAVVGSGLSSLTVAWDLVRKGYGVTVFEPGEIIGATLIEKYPQLLSEKIIAVEADLLAQLRVRFETRSKQTSAKACTLCLDTHEAVYVGLDAVSANPWGIDTAIDPDRDKLFAGGKHPSPVWQAARGRWAATSIDRWLQKVSMTAGREKEGPFETRLFTDLKGLKPLPAVAMADPKAGFSQAEAQKEAARCLQCQCLECVKVCLYLESFGAYPKKYAREIYNNESIVMGERQANRLINSCSLCGLCETVCPNDFAMAELCLTARQSMVARAKMPPSAHDFALQDMDFSLSDRFAMARHAPGRSASRHLFFPGCQLCASSPEHVPKVYDHLEKNLSGGVALMLGCCGAPAHWSGRQETFAAQMAKWKATWSRLGRPRPIMACATCLRMFKDHLPEAQVISLWEVLEETGIPQAGLSPPQVSLAIHDPCTTRAEPEVQKAVRRLLSKMGLAVEELVLGREKTECCGFGGLMQNANPDLARAVANARAKRSSKDYLVYCAMCRDSLTLAGKPTLHLLDLLFGADDVCEPVLRPRPGWSRRRENRARLKADLEQRLWDLQPPDSADYQKIVLQIDADVAARLESRRILKEDIQKVIQHAQGSGSRLCHKNNGHLLAALRPFQATFWVEYSPTAEGFKVHNAYAHRMEVLGP